MIFDIRIYIIVAMFMLACISLMFFNFVIIRYSKSKYILSTNKINKWKHILHEQMTRTSNKGIYALKHEKLLLKKLSKPENLITYSHALQYLKNQLPQAYNIYTSMNYSAFKKLADIYSRKPSIERACYADFICNFPQVAGKIYTPLLDTLVSHIDNSHIHCRTNILRALCSIGNVQGISNALQLINDKILFMHSEILTNELSNFKGNKQALANCLWNESRSWNNNTMIAVIQFITEFSEHYREAFLPILYNPSVDLEVRIAAARYFEKHIYEPAYPILIELITNPADINLSAVAASA